MKVQGLLLQVCLIEINQVWKSNKSTKHYPTQMLLAINWHLTGGKNSHMSMKVQGHFLKVCFIEIDQFFAKENKVGYFSNRIL